MKRILLPIFLLLFSLIGGITGYSIFNQDDHVHGEEHEHSLDSNKILVDASWGDEEPNVEALIESADLVVVAELGEEIGSYQPFEGHEDAFTDVTLNIKEVLQGDFSEENEELILSQYGGVREDNTIEEFIDLPFLEEENTYLFFLEKIEVDNERDGKYQYVGGPQGYYFLEEEVSLFSSNTESIDYDIDAPEKIGITAEVSDISFQELKDIIDE